MFNLSTIKLFLWTYNQIAAVRSVDRSLVLYALHLPQVFRALSICTKTAGILKMNSKLVLLTGLDTLALFFFFTDVSPFGSTRTLPVPIV